MVKRNKTKKKSNIDYVVANLLIKDNELILKTLPMAMKLIKNEFMSL